MVKVYDEDTNQVVFERLVRGGESIAITVSGNRARFEYKYPEDANYHSNTGFYCKNGESTNF